MNCKCRTGKRNNLLVLTGLAIICLVLSQAVRSRNVPDTAGRGQPFPQSAVTYTDCIAQHSIGQLVVQTRWAPDFTHVISPAGEIDCRTGEEIEGFGAEYPKGSYVEYLWSGYWSIGAVVGEDTLVSTPGEFYVHNYPYQSTEYRSTIDPTAPEYEGAVSEEDYIIRAFDTIPWDAPYRPEPDYFGMRRHIPLGIEITNRSYAWSYGYAEDFVLYDFGFENIGELWLDKVYLSLTINGRVSDRMHWPYDDLGGLLKTFPSPLECGLVDTLNMIWMADADGDPLNGEYEQILKPRSATAVTGVRVLGTPTTVFGEEPDMSYNWWVGHVGHGIRDFGPRHRANLRDFRTGGLGEPAGDVNRYYMMRNGEIDYDPVFTATIRNLDYLWLYPNQEVAWDLADGYGDITHTLSFGPFVIPPGGTLPIAFAYVAGENFHTDPENIENLPYNPTEYYKNLDFSDLALNSTYASWIYDNPGVDTDGDGVAGKFTICALDSSLTDSGWIVTAADTVYYAGDGVPDWRAAGPPPAPKVWLEPIVNGVRVRFNGMRSETEKDIFTRVVDFEGYRVYFGRDERISSYAMIASYDREDFNKFIWVPQVHGGNYRLRDAPFTRDSLRCLYGAGPDPCNDEDFNPLFHTIINPYVHPRFPDSMFYFARHDHNVSHLGLTTPIRKVYANEPDPSGQAEATLQPDQFTGDGYLKFYEYEFIIEDLLPSVSYWINVTAFDFGSPKSHLAGLETSITLGAQMIFPYDNESAATVATDQKMSVYVYPNPYRIDAGYRGRGFEGRTSSPHLNEEKVRAIHFAHLPPKCTIRIFSIDGDLVDYIDHDMAPDDPNSSHDSWDLVSRNREPVVSGLYYWTIETPTGQTQLGKLSIIM